MGDWKVEKPSSGNNDTTMKDLKFLSEAALELADIDSEGDIFDLIGQHLLSINEDSYIIVNSYTEATGESEVKSVHGLGKFTTNVMEAFRWDSGHR